MKFNVEHIKEQLTWFIELSLVVILCFILIFHIRDTDFTVLLENQEDAVALATQAQDYISGVNRIELVAMPYEEEQIVTLNAGVLHLFLLRLITLFCKSFGLAGNLLYLLGYILTAISMYVVLKIKNVQNGIAFVLSVIYAFLPYHYLRGERHIYLGMYYMVPFICWIIIEMFDGKINLTTKINQFEKKRIFFVLGIVILLALADIYYTVFACILLVISGLSSSLKNKDKGHIVAAIVLCTIMILTISLINIPYISVILSGKQTDKAVSGRGLDELERYGIRIAQLLLPIQNHRVAYLARIRAEYDKTISINETQTATLGFITSCGFCMSVFFSLICSARTEMDRRIQQLGIINIICVLIATIGGFNIFVGMISSSIRCYNRMSIFIATFSIMALSVLLQNRYHKIQKTNRNKFLFLTGLIILLGFSLFEQTPQFSEGYYKENALLDSNIRTMVEQIEEIVPENSMIFMLPILTENEDSLIYNMRNYEQQWPVIYSNTLRWSATTNPTGIVGEKNQNRQWKKALSYMPMKEMLDNVCFAGFEGIWLDENGYKESEFLKVKQEIEKYLGKPLITSNTGKQFYYTLSGFVKELKNHNTDNLWKQNKEKSLSLGNLQGDYYGAESLYYSGNAEYAGDNILKIGTGGIQYGPYIKLEKGNYILVLAGNWISEKDFTITSDAQAEIIKHHTLRNSDNYLMVEFSLKEEKKDIEFIIHNSDSTDIEVYFYYLEEVK